ncbi:hypothetical protein HanRHA438_Chr16g0754401 [Helianthus annuus]|nr:hypothetical protein HanRHA438_Chr16g0754401 [Helianthus annuus]
MLMCIILIEIKENIVNGSFNMMFIGHSLSLGYRNHTNIVMRYFNVMHFTHCIK